MNVFLSLQEFGSENVLEMLFFYIKFESEMVL